jgi:hypothetical protein
MEDLRIGISHVNISDCTLGKWPTQSWYDSTGHRIERIPLYAAARKAQHVCSILLDHVLAMEDSSDAIKRSRALVEE